MVYCSSDNIVLLWPKRSPPNWALNNPSKRVPKFLENFKTLSLTEYQQINDIYSLQVDVCFYFPVLFSLYSFQLLEQYNSIALESLLLHSHAQKNTWTFFFICDSRISYKFTRKYHSMCRIYSQATMHALEHTKNKNTHTAGKNQDVLQTEMPTTWV